MSEPEHVTSRQLLTARLSQGGLFLQPTFELSLTRKGTRRFGVNGASECHCRNIHFLLVSLYACLVFTSPKFLLEVVSAIKDSSWSLTSQGFGGECMNRADSVQGSAWSSGSWQREAVSRYIHPFKAWPLLIPCNCFSGPIKKRTVFLINSHDKESLLFRNQRLQFCLVSLLF